MSEHLTYRARMSRLKLLLSSDSQRFFNLLALESHRAKKRPKPYSGMRYNEFLITDAWIAERLGVSKYAANKLKNEGIDLKWFIVRKIPGCKKTCVRWNHPTKCKKPSNSSPVLTFESKTTKQLKNSEQSRYIASKAFKAFNQEKGRGNGGDSPRPSRLPSEIESHQTHPLKTLSRMGGTGQKHTLYFVTPLGFHPVAPEGHRDTTPPVWTHASFEAFLGHAIALGADLHQLPRLDRKALSDLTHKGRKALLRGAFEYYRAAEGTQEQRRQQAEEKIKADILGNYQDQVERKKMGVLTTKYAELYDVFGPGSEGHRERKGWCVERGRQTMNENWVTRDRPREEGEKAAARDRAQKEAMKTSVEELSLLSRQLANDFMAGRLSRKDFARKMDEVEIRLAEAHPQRSAPFRSEDTERHRGRAPSRVPERSHLRLVGG